jgi:hypothetical protein
MPMAKTSASLDIFGVLMAKQDRCIRKSEQPIPDLNRVEGISKCRCIGADILEGEPT